MGKRWITFNVGVMLGVGPEHVGGRQQLLEAEVLEDGLRDEEVKLGVEAAAEVELHQHVAAALAVTALQEVLPRLGILPRVPQPVCNVLKR